MVNSRNKLYNIDDSRDMVDYNRAKADDLYARGHSKKALVFYKKALSLAERSEDLVHDKGMLIKIIRDVGHVKNTEVSRFRKAYKYIFIVVAVLGFLFGVFLPTTNISGSVISDLAHNGFGVAGIFLVFCIIFIVFIYLKWR